MTDQWEYTYLSAGTGGRALMNQHLNRLGAEGWEVVGFASADKTIGVNSITALLKRRLVAPPPPADLEPAWHDDPCGRFDKRYWNGEVWTAQVGRAADKSVHLDPPSLLVQPATV